MQNADDQEAGKVQDKRQRHARFWRKYLRLTRAGISVLRALDIVRQEERDDKFREVIGKIRDQIERGVPMSKVLKEHASEFSLSEVELIRIAEKRGAWDEVLQEIADGLLDGTFE